MAASTSRLFVIRNAHLATMAGSEPYGLIRNGAIAIAKGKIVWVGETRAAPRGYRNLDAKGCVLTPGLIDCHTHLVYGGNRAGEFELRLSGISYAEIAKRGGGILSTVRATRQASHEELSQSAGRRLRSLRSEGVTTVEIKSGYGLDGATERKMLRVARGLSSKGIDVVTTYLGAHAIPPEFKDNRQGYLDLVCNKVLPSIAKAGLADAVDAFCEGIAFSRSEVEGVFRTAVRLKLPIKLHAEQLSNSGGAKLAASYGALSCDHLEYLDEDAAQAMAQSGTVAVILPGAFYYLGEKQVPPIALLRRLKIPMAVATDLNPGSSPVHSLLSAMNLACVLFRLTPEESLRGATVNAARALGLRDRGALEPGLKADLAMWKVEKPGDLAYPLGFNPCDRIFKDGKEMKL